jgi:hypothetical protein
LGLCFLKIENDNHICTIAKIRKFKQFSRKLVLNFFCKFEFLQNVIIYCMLSSYFNSLPVLYFRNFCKHFRAKQKDFKGIVFDGVLWFLSYSLYSMLGMFRLTFFFLILCFHIQILSVCFKHHVWQKKYSRVILWKMRHFSRSRTLFGFNSVRVATQAEIIINDKI